MLRLACEPGEMGKVCKRPLCHHRGFGEGGYEARGVAGGDKVIVRTHEESRWDLVGGEIVRWWCGLVVGGLVAPSAEVVGAEERGVPCVAPVSPPSPNNERAFRCTRLFAGTPLPPPNVLLIVNQVTHGGAGGKMRSHMFNGVCGVHTGCATDGIYGYLT